MVTPGWHNGIRIWISFYALSLVKLIFHQLDDLWDASLQNWSDGRKIGFALLGHEWHTFWRRAPLEAKANENIDKVMVMK